MNDAITLRYSSRTTGATGRVKDSDTGRVRTFATREEAEAYCREHSTGMVSYYIDEE